MKQLKITQLLDLSKTIAADLFDSKQYTFEVVPLIKDFILQLQGTLSKDFEIINDNVYIHKTAKVAKTAFINGPCIIDQGAEIRHCAFIRGCVIIGKNAVVGNSTELKNSILFDNVQVPHFNYAGDSILGYKAHMGAGCITSNVKSDKSLVKVKGADFEIETGLKKLGAVLGDYVEIGCNSVLSPGSIIGRNSNVYPLSMVRGFVTENSIYKNRNEIVEKY